jgi:GxxExxY protein
MNSEVLLPAGPVCAILAAASKVLDSLGPGLSPGAYFRALAIELRRSQVPFEQEQANGVYYADELVDVYIASLVVEEDVLVDVRVQPAIDGDSRAQALGALAITGLPHALLLNFQRAELEWLVIPRAPAGDER